MTQAATSNTQNGPTVPDGNEPRGQSLLSSDFLECLEQVAKAVKKFSWRRRRDLSIKVYQGWKAYLPPELAYRAATTMFRVVPEWWLTISETLRALRRLGVNTYDRRLYRIRAKMARHGGDIGRVTLDADGHADGVPPGNLRQPVAILTFRLSGPIHFQVSKFAPKA